MAKNLLWIQLVFLTILSASSFQVPHLTTSVAAGIGQKQCFTSLNVFGGGKKKKEKEDLSYIETRDMTREEMLEYNRQSEDIMNQEIIGMTVFSLLISAPLLYLAWVGLFAETNEIASGI